MFCCVLQEFLEERRVALEVALRRLTINAIRADAAVQADLRAFLGFPPCPTSFDADIVRHLARVPPNLELALPARGPSPIHLLSNLRLTMWMLLSGAAHKVGTIRLMRPLLCFAFLMLRHSIYCDLELVVERWPCTSP